MVPLCLPVFVSVHMSIREQTMSKSNKAIPLIKGRDYLILALDSHLDNPQPSGYRDPLMSVKRKAPIAAVLSVHLWRN